MKFKEIKNIFDNPKEAEIKSVLKKLSQLPLEEVVAFSRIASELSSRSLALVLDSELAESLEQLTKQNDQLLFEEYPQIQNRLQDENEELHTKIKWLRSFSYFSDLSIFELTHLADFAKKYSIEAGKAFIELDKIVEYVVIINDIADIYIDRNQLPLLSRSGIFGEDICFSENEKSTITIILEHNAEACCFKKEDFIQLVAALPVLKEKVIQSIIKKNNEKLTMAKHESTHAKEQYKLTQEILDNIGQGSFSINHMGEIGENYTPIAAEYLGRKELAGVPFADVILKNSRKALRNYYRALSTLFSDNQFDPEVILGLLPRQVEINSRTFKLHYSFVEDDQGFIISLFVRMEEITQELLEQKMEEEQLIREENEKRVLDKLRNNVAGFIHMLENVKNSFQMTKEFKETFLDQGIQPPEENITALMRALHSSKGLSAQFELFALRDSIHRIEDCVQAIQKEGFQTQIFLFATLFKKFKTEDQQTESLKENLGSDIIELLQGVTFSQEEYGQLLEFSVNNQLEAVIKILQSKNLISSSLIVENWKADIKRLAAGLGKQIDFRVQTPGDLELSKKLVEILNLELGHLYRNCVDHGIETPEVRKQAGKPESGLIKVIMHEDDGKLNLVIEDDGAGLDYDKIIEIARHKDNIDQAKVDLILEEKQPWKILFIPGFSSSGEVTHLSGRGVGMDAVQNALQNVNGTITVKSELGQGCQFIIRINMT